LEDPVNVQPAESSSSEEDPVFIPVKFEIWEAMNGQEAVKKFVENQCSGTCSCLLK